MFSKKLKVISTVVFLLVCTAGQEYASSPCPNIFRYEFDGVETYGIMELPAPPLGTNIVLQLSMSIKAKLPTRDVGRIEMVGTNDVIVHQLLNGLNLKYKVHFPLPSPLPKVTSIIYNGQQYCYGPPETFNGPSQYVTSIDLDHKLATSGVSGGQIARPAAQGPAAPPSQPSYTSVNPNNQEFNQITPYTYYLIPRKQTQNHYPNYNYDPYNRFGTPNRPPIYYNYDINNRNPYSEDQYNALRPVDSEPQYVRPPAPQQNIPVQPRPSPQRPTQGIQQCGRGRKDNFLIVGGEETAPGDWPWLTALYTMKTNGPVFTCGATLITAKHVVTAGHCVSKQNKPYSVDDIFLGFGGHKLFDFGNSNSQVRSPLQILLHPSFSSSPLLSDIALLLVAEVTFSAYVKPVCFWQGDDSLEKVVGQTGTSVGWGRDGSGAAHTSEPRMLEVPIVSTDTCRGSQSDFFSLTSDTTLCAGNKDGSSPCNGDSGGGLYMLQGGSWSLRGVISVSLKDKNSNYCDTTQYVVYTDVAKYMSWIRQTTGF